jgi:hypothetical protein
MIQNRRNTPLSVSGIPEKTINKRRYEMSRVRTAWQLQQNNQPYDDKRPIEPRLNDPYNLWDNDDSDEPLAIDINEYADKED